MPMRDGMRGLTVIVADRSSERLRAALTLAAAQAALGGRARLFCQGEAAAMLRPPIEGEGDEAHDRAGLPMLAELVEEALTLGVELIACQSGLALTGIDATTFDPRVGAGGPVGVLQSLGDDRLVVI
ncbi:peroxiredoxin [Sphingomonas sp.]|uniref:peroxiredoxin n=1 Tax=Sphingomonas sp. TaxID=28214 RepID=UPI003B00061C